MRTSKISSGNSASEDFQFPVTVPSKGQDYPLVLAYWIMERQTWLFRSVQSESSFQAFGNVNVVGKGHAINQMGSSALAAILNAAALLLKLSTDLLHALASLPRDLILINYTSDTVRIEYALAIFHPANSSFYRMQKAQAYTLERVAMHLYYAVETPTTPDAFEIFGGSPWLIHSRAYMEYCVQGWDNLPLMYLSNTASPLESYFH
ncbi:hypothetical protein POTOM_039085 [Populus tomentosa]|uniref:Uncharacterized protein n=1 Tax=Populus tomentosa TaxID=118781 RepID=A0A8X7Z8B6_POPTO|nr:hypothetical protein POTOM_039085 [Populus tomentosa]